MREPGVYSNQEFMAEQGHRDRVRTADCTNLDKLEREHNDDDSHKESDWHDRTSIKPSEFWAQKKLERDLQKKRDEDKKTKERHIKHFGSLSVGD